MHSYYNLCISESIFKQLLSALFWLAERNAESDVNAFYIESQQKIYLNLFMRVVVVRLKHSVMVFKSESFSAMLIS